MLRFKHYLMLEAKIDDYKAQETNISTEHDPNAEHKSAADIIDHFHKHAPGGNVQHTRWMIDKYKKGEIKQEDAPDMRNALNSFEKYKPQLPKKKIEQYKSVSELKTSLHPHQEQDEKVKSVNQDKIDKGSTIIHNSPKVTAYHVHTTEAAQELGKKDNGHRLGWCTSHPDPNKNMFNHYNEESNGNFHILHMHKEQYPYRKIGGVGIDNEFQDENNKTIEGKDFHNLLKRNPELEKIPAVTNSRHYKMQKASNPNATKEDLDKLANDDDSGIRATVAKNSPHKEHIDSAINDENRWVRDSAASNPHATKEHLDKLSKDTDSFVKGSVARFSPHKEHLDKLINDTDYNVRARIAANPHATKKHLDKLANSDESVDKSAAAEYSPYKEHLDKLVDDKSDNKSLIKAAVARNRNATKDHLDKLIDDDSNYVKATVARFSPHKEHLDKLIHGNPALRTGVAANPHATKEHLDHLVDDPNTDVKKEVAENPNATKEHLRKLANDEDEEVSQAAQNHPNYN